MRWLSLLCGVAYWLASAPAQASDERVDRCIDAATNAQSERAEGRLLAARSTLLSCAHEDCPAPIRKDCQRWFEQVDEQVPSIVPSAQGHDGSDQPNASLTVDGTPHRLDGRPIEVDPGPHELIWRSGDQQIISKIVVRLGEKGRLIDGTFPAKVVAGPSIAPPGEFDSAPTTHAEEGLPLAFWLLGGGALIGAASAAGFGVSASQQHDDLTQSCAPRCSPEQVESVERDVTLANISIGLSLAAAAAAVGVGVAWYLTDESSATAELAIDGHGLRFTAGW